MPERLRTLRHCIFTGGGHPFRLLPLVTATFPKGTAELPQSKPDGFASSLGEGASGAAGNFALEPETVPPCQRPHPRGGCRRRRLGEFKQTTSSVKKQFRNARRRFGTAIKIFFPLLMPKVQRRRPPPAAETGRSCWGSGQQDARAAQGTMRMLGAATR